MGKSMLSIHKEIEKKAYQQSPLGKLESQLRKIYDGLSSKNEKLPEEVAKKVYDIRDANEKAQMDYIERTNREHKEYVDKMLYESMSKELEVLKEHLKL